MKPQKKSAGFDLLPFSQQSSSDDGMAAVLVQKIQSGLEKKKKENEDRYLQAYHHDTQETNARGIEEFMDHCSQIDETFDNFTLAYAKADDEIRAIWNKIIRTHALFTAKVREQLETEIKQDKEREEQHVLGLAYHRKSEEAFARAIATLVEVDPE